MWGSPTLTPFGPAKGDGDSGPCLLTGFADLMHESGQRSENVDPVLSKPARLEDLRKAILAVTAER